MKKFLLSCLTILVLTACNVNEKVAYVQGVGMSGQITEPNRVRVPEATIKIGDLMVITINTQTPESAIPFNLPLVPAGESSLTYNTQGNNSYLSYGFGMQNYLVDNRGFINFPVLGKIDVEGLTKDELEGKIRSMIFPKYLKEEPIILIRYVNFKVSVLGEVLKPGIYNLDNEKGTIFEALALAGDLTIYGERSNVLLIRESKGVSETIRIDLLDKALFQSPYYYLQQNDVIYIQPNTAKSRSSMIGTAESLSISIVGTLISLTSLLINIIK